MELPSYRDKPTPSALDNFQQMIAKLDEGETKPSFRERKKATTEASLYVLEILKASRQERDEVVKALQSLNETDPAKAKSAIKTITKVRNALKEMADKKNIFTNE